MTSALCAFYFFRSKRKDVFLDISSFNLQQGKTISFALFFKKLFPVLYSVSNILVPKGENNYRVFYQKVLDRFSWIVFESISLVENSGLE